MNNTVKWFEEFFLGFWGAFQDSFTPEDRTQLEADFIERFLIAPMLQLPRNASLADISGVPQLSRNSLKIMDVPCGRGRISIELAKRGYQVIGVDFAEEAIKTANAKKQEEQVEVEFHQFDMREIHWESEFDVVVCLFGSFGYFSDEDNEKFVKAVSKSLKPDGWFLMDSIEYGQLARMFEPKSFAETEDFYVLEKREMDFQTSRIECEWTTIDKKNGRFSTNKSSIRIYTIAELIKLFESAGFCNFEFFSNFEGSPFTIDSKRMYFLAQKT